MERSCDRAKCGTREQLSPGIFLDRAAVAVVAERGKEEHACVETTPLAVRDVPSAQKQRRGTEYGRPLTDQTPPGEGKDRNRENPENCRWETHRESAGTQGFLRDGPQPVVGRIREAPQPFVAMNCRNYFVAIHGPAAESPESGKRGQQS